MKITMKGILASLLLVSLIANLFLIRNYMHSKKKSSISLDELVLINSDVDIKMLIESGYQYGGMPCGMVHYSKTISDSIFTYSFYLDEKRQITNWDNYPSNEDSTSIYYPFNKKYIDNSVSRPIHKEVQINLGQMTFEQVDHWLKSTFPYYMSDFTEIEFEGKRDFVLHNHMQKIKMQCGIEMDTLINSRIERTLCIYSDLPYLDHKKKEEMNEFQEELSRRYMEEFYDTKELEFIEN